MQHFTKQNLAKPALCALALLCLTPAMAEADHKWIEGRTGLPTVREGGNKVWMENGNVTLNVSGDTLHVTQDFRLHYPGPPLEKASRRLQIAVREDFFRSLDNGAPKVRTGKARGFTAFAVYVDGHYTPSQTENWKVNQKQDTATRWRTWEVTFYPGQVRQMRIVSRAPLGEEGHRKYVQFVSKDLSEWRGAPNYLEIRFHAPGTTDSRLAALEPRPNDINSRAVRWVYRAARPHRDIYLQLPPGYGQTARRD
jgi:hypothetical protein